MKYVKTEPHPIKTVRSSEGRHYVPGTHERCFCHGHCGECGGPVVMDKLGRYRHTSRKEGIR